MIIVVLLIEDISLQVHPSTLIGWYDIDCEQNGGNLFHFPALLTAYFAPLAGNLPQMCSLKALISFIINFCIIRKELRGKFKVKTPFRLPFEVMQIVFLGLFRLRIFSGCGQHHPSAGGHSGISSSPATGRALSCSTPTPSSTAACIPARRPTRPSPPLPRTAETLSTSIPWHRAPIGARHVIDGRTSTQVFRPRGGSALPKAKFIAHSSP